MDAKWKWLGDEIAARDCEEVARRVGENSAKNEFNGGTKARIVESSSRLVV